MNKSRIYFINYESRKLSGGDKRYAAASKAREDVKKLLLQRSDIVYMPVVRKHLTTICGGIELLVKLFFTFIKVPRNSKVFIQYPMIDIGAFRIISYLFRRYELIAIIHDLSSYRYEDVLKYRSKEIAILNRMSAIIVHSKAMRDVLINDGVHTRMEVLGIFDYLLEENQNCIKETNAIVFAGALEKSLFLKELHTINLAGIKFNLYGKNVPNIPPHKEIMYNGAFLPDDISNVKGDWGLLWDGESVNDCKGNFGNYLTIIAPHKLSLYIACGFKVIVWKKSAMADLVRKENIGVVISSLNEISEKISSLSEDDIKMMSDNVKALSNKIRQGLMFINCFDKIISG